MRHIASSLKLVKIAKIMRAPNIQMKTGLVFKTMEFELFSASAARNMLLICCSRQHRSRRALVAVRCPTKGEARESRSIMSFILVSWHYMGADQQR
jgi:hypothetical protein